MIEDEAWDELEERIKLQTPVSVMEAFEQYQKGAQDQSIRKAFLAGWVAGIRNEYLKSREL
jgi:hypothetical protein